MSLVDCLEMESSMDLWTLYDYILSVHNKYIISQGDCLYNGLVLSMAEMTESELVRVRNSAYELITFIEQEIMAKQEEIEDYGDPDHHEE